MTASALSLRYAYRLYLGTCYSKLTKFVKDLKKHLSSQLSDHNVESVVYPKYATKGELTEASVNFLEW